MNIVHITTTTRGGAGIAALRLHNALREEGISSAYISRNLTLDYQGKQIEDPILAYKKPSLVKRIGNKIRRILFPSESDKLTTAFEHLYSQLNYEIASLPFSTTKLEDHPLIQQANIVHLHWISGILDYPRFFSKINKPVVWTLHDMNPFKGLFHYDLDELQNKAAGALDEKIKQIKSRALGKIRNGALVCPSQWLLNAASKSGVFDHFSIKTTIANSISGEIYGKANQAEARKTLKLNPSEKIVLFTAAQVDNARKGSHLLIDALEKLDFPLTLLVLGKGRLKIANKKVKIIPLGYMSNDTDIANCYAAADAFVLPSLEDNLPNTMLESFASGTPVIAFATGGIEEHIKTGVHGVLVEKITSGALAKALVDFCNDQYQFDDKAIKKYAKQQFDGKKQVIAYLDIYQKLTT